MIGICFEFVRLKDRSIQTRLRDERLMQLKNCVVACLALCLLAADGERLAVVQGVAEFSAWTGAQNAPRMLAVSSAGAQLWDTDAHVAVRTFENIDRAVLSPDGRFIAAKHVGSNDIDVIATAGGDSLATIPLADEPQSPLAISPNDALLAVDRPRYDAPGMVVVRAQTGAIAYSLSGAGGGAAFSPDGHMLATLDTKRRALLLWDAGSGKFLKRFDGDAGVFGPPLFSPNGRYLLTVANAARTPPHGDGSFALNSRDYPELVLDVWDLRANRVMRRFPFWNDQGRNYDEHPGLYAFVAQDRIILSRTNAPDAIADIASGRVIRLDVSGSVVRSGRRIEVIDKNAWMELSGTTIGHVLEFNESVSFAKLALSADGHLAAAAQRDLFVWNLADPASTCVLLLEGAPDDFGFATSGELVVRYRGKERRVDPRSCAIGSAQTDQPAQDIEFSADQTRVIALTPPGPSARDTGMLEVRTAGTNQLIASIPGLLRGSSRLARVFALYAPIAAFVTNDDERIAIVDARSGTLRAAVPRRDATAISPDGSTLAVASQTQTVLYDTQSGLPVASYGYADSQMVYSPSGKYFIGENSDGVLRIHTLEGRTIATLSAVSTPAGSNAWIITLPNGDFAASPGGTAFVCGGRDDAAAVRRELAAVVK